MTFLRISASIKAYGIIYRNRRSAERWQVDTV